MSFLREHFGFTFSFPDPECGVIEIQGRDLSEAEIITALGLYASAVKIRMNGERDRRMAVFMGGPLDGRSCLGVSSTSYVNNGGVVTARIILRIGPAQWAVYNKIGFDPRARFCGIATSKAKARQAEIVGEQS